jgi:subtilisin-like proprotein convertase family protein
VSIQLVSTEITGIAAPNSTMTMEVIDSSQTPVTGTVGGIYNLPTGTYSIKISGYNSTGYTGNTYRIDLKPAPIQEVEPNNTLLTATPINDIAFEMGGTTMSGTDEDPDYFSLSVPTTGMYKIKGAAFASSYDYCLTWFFHDSDAQATIQWEADEVVDRNVFLFANETYYIRAAGTCSATQEAIPYTFGITPVAVPYDAVDAEPNDLSAQAQTVAPKSFPLYTIAGKLNSIPDQDWYRVTLPVGTHQLFVGSLGGYTSPQGSLTATLFASDGVTELGQDMVTITTAGEYLLRVDGFAPGQNAYTVRVGVVSSASPNATINYITPVASSTIVVPSQPSCILSDLVVYLNIPHDYRGDLEVRLQAPNGTSYLLLDNYGGSALNLIGTVPGDFPVNTSLSSLVGQPFEGSWTLTVTDTYDFSDDGVFSSWTLLPTCQ